MIRIKDITETLCTAPARSRAIDDAVKRKVAIIALPLTVCRLLGALLTILDRYFLVSGALYGSMIGDSRAAK